MNSIINPKYEFYHLDGNIAKISAYYALHDIYKPSKVSGQNGPLSSRREEGGAFFLISKNAR